MPSNSLARTAGRALASLAPIFLFAPFAHADDSLPPLPQIVIEPPEPLEPREPQVPVEAPVARARPPVLRVEPQPKTHWYGWQTLVVDGASLALFVGAVGGGGSDASGTLAVASLVTYGIGGPIVHFAHGHVGKGFADLGLRVGLPLLFGAVGYASGDPSCHGDGFFCLPSAVAYASIGALIGIGGAIALDAALLAREDVEAPKDAAAAHAAPKPMFHLVPDLRLGKDRSTIGLRATF